MKTSVIAGALLLLIAQEASAEPVVQPQQKFELSASMSAKPQLSRGEMSRDSLGMGSLAQPMRPVVRDSLLATVPDAAPAPQADQPSSYLSEYNVNWGAWVGSLADRWFYILRSAEYALGVQFACPRPALIQFTCYADGTIGNVSLKQSSGVPAYDRLQIEALLAAAPIPPFPSGTKRTSITLVQGWESHPKRAGEEDFQPGSFGRDFPLERVREWLKAR